MKVLAFAASNSLQSINKKLVTYASSLINDADIDILDINDYEMPLYSIDREENEGIPDLAHQFYAKIGNADALLISYAEHNGSYTAAYKNLYDWTSRIDMKVFQNKPTLLLATSPGPGGARNVLSTAVNSAPHFGAELVADLSVASFYDNFDVESATVSDPTIATQLNNAISKLTQAMANKNS
ncbi:MAG: NADPH-dependent FMN reductase [Arenicella sp.]